MGERSSALRSLVVAAALSLLLMTAATVPAFASEASDQREGQRLLRSIEEGRSECNALANSDFEHIGEYVMGRMAGSTAAHEQMDELMRSMMGARSEEQMHVFMGRRFTGCGGSTAPAGFGGMMGVMGMMGGGLGTAAGGNGFGAMMGTGGVEDGGDGWSDAAIVMTVLMGVLLALAAAALLAWRPWRASPPQAAALEVLDARYARGELDAEDYERRRQALRR